MIFVQDIRWCIGSMPVKFLFDKTGIMKMRLGPVFTTEDRRSERSYVSLFSIIFLFLFLFLRQNRKFHFIVFPSRQNFFNQCFFKRTFWLPLNGPNIISP